MTDNSKNQDQGSSSNMENETIHNAGGPYNSGMGGTGSGMESSSERGTEGLGNQSQGMSGDQGGTSSSGTDWGSQQGQDLDLGNGSWGRGSTTSAGSSRISDGDRTDDRENVSNTSTNSEGE